MATGRIAEALHLEQTDLVQATSKDVYYVTVMSRSLSQVIIELETVSFRAQITGAKLEFTFNAFL